MMIAIATIPTVNNALAAMIAVLDVAAVCIGRKILSSDWLDGSIYPSYSKLISSESDLQKLV